MDALELLRFIDRLDILPPAFSLLILARSSQRIFLACWLASSTMKIFLRSGCRPDNDSQNEGNKVCVFIVFPRANATAFSRLCQLSRATFG